MLYRPFLYLSLILAGCTSPPPQGTARPYIYLNGTNYLEVLSTIETGYMSTEDFTIEGWFTSDDEGGSELMSLFMVSNDRGENTLGLYLDPGDMSTWVLFLDDIPAGQKNAGYRSSDGEIHYAVFSYTRSTGAWTLYLDGKSFMSGTQQLPLDFQNSNLLLGADYDAPNGDTGNLWRGRLYEWRLWRVDSDAETVDFKNEHPDKVTVRYSPTWQDSVLAIWRMNSVEDGIVQDDGPYDNSAILMDIGN